METPITTSLDTSSRICYWGDRMSIWSNQFGSNDGVLTFLVLQDVSVFLVDHYTAKTVVRPETDKREMQS